jgi:Rrf2 family iron-sulfur cluster assembly transcriptional regulator
MKFAAQEEIGLRCMVRMARNPAAAAKIERIAELESLSPAYVAKMMRLFRVSGLVESIRGQKGGYRLSRDPVDVCLSEVLDALGERFHAIEDCKKPVGGGRRCIHQEDCAIRSLWSGIDLLIRGFLSNCRLSDLLGNEQKTKRWVKFQIRKMPSLVKSQKL